MKKLILSTLAGAALATAAAPIVLAQSAGPESAAPQARHEGPRGPHGERAFRLPSERVEARLAYLKTALKITDAQQPQWDAFADTLRKQARAADQRVQERRAQTGQRPERGRTTAIERLERRQKLMAAAAARMDETLVATKPLYAALSPEQQKVADELLAPRGRGGFRERGGHRPA